MSESYPALVLKALGWLLTACSTPETRNALAQMWPNSLPIHESSQGPPAGQRIARFRLLMIASVGVYTSSVDMTNSRGVVTYIASYWYRMSNLC